MKKKQVLDTIDLTKEIEKKYSIIEGYTSR